MLTRVQSAAIYGIDVRTVDVEVTYTDLEGEGSNATGCTIIVGLPDAAIRESKERIFTAIKESGFWLGKSKTVFNLAPADLRKNGSAYDLPMTIGLLGSSFLKDKMDRALLQETLVIGELGLNGEVRRIRGALPIAMHAKSLGLKTIILPSENAKEAAAAQDITVIGVKTLREAVAYFLHCCEVSPTVVDLSTIYENVYDDIADFMDVKGQEAAKRAMTIAAAGNHNILLIGPPGTGKSMLAKRLPGIMPPLSIEESLEVTKVHSIAGVLDSRKGIIVQRPFRNPHHTVSDAGLVGGQSVPRPGELTLAHCGILFLDELPEFRRSTLEVLRQPIENGEVTLSRATGSFVFPSKVMLVAAMNPCPCGYLGSKRRQCKCSQFQIAAYRSRISGPMLDRIDMHVEVANIDDDTLIAKRNGENSASMRAKVLAAREIQRRRYAGTKIRDNASLNGKLMDEVCALTPDCAYRLRFIINELQLSARSYDRILRVARTIADLNGGGPIRTEHIDEASFYRLLDRAN